MTHKIIRKLINKKKREKRENSKIEKNLLNENLTDEKLLISLSFLLRNFNEIKAATEVSRRDLLDRNE